MSADLTRRAFLAGAAAAGLAACGGGRGNGSAASGSPASSSSASSTTATSSTAPATASATGPARFVDTGPTGRHEVALTFHTSGDPTRFRELADILRARHVVITAFIVGEWLDANPDLGRRLRDEGHELANHTYTHPSFASLTAGQMADEIARCRAAIANIVPGGGHFFRPSGTADGTGTPPASVLAAAGDGGYPVVLGFDVDPLDYQDPGADAVAQRTVSGLHDGAVVSLHFDHPGTITALPRILDAVASAGLTPVTASQLLQS